MLHDRAAGSLPVLIRLWLGLTAVLPGLIARQARRAHLRQGADPARIMERLGHASRARPGGALVWLHAASVGEVASVARLGQAILATQGRALLVTTTTATGAATVARLLPGAVHQFVPVDTPDAVARFLDHWRPDAALFVEGDLWPRMILALERRGCPMALLNARASRSRARFPAVYAALLSRMTLITVQDADLLGDLCAMGLDPARLHAPGNLKADLSAPAVDPVLRDAILRAAAGRSLWAAVSTHPGEDEMALDAHAGVRGAPLLLLVPRHPERGDAVAAELGRRGVAFTRHSRGELPDAGTPVHLVDALGLTGTVYAVAGLAFVGGSLVPGIGGHTPYEPAATGCAILSGPHVANFAAAYRALVDAGAARIVPGQAELSGEVARLLSDKAAVDAMQGAARSFHAAQAGATDATLALLTRVLP
jgi:3-deoxy-D-manno-octulosonic-acid transferase